MSQRGRNDDEALAEANQTIARQQALIERLNARLAEDGLGERLRAALSVVAAIGRIAAPTTHGRLLELIVATAARTLSARAGSLFLIDDDGKNLVFEVALGEKAEEAKRFRVPIGHGVAGLVAASGQPLAISDVEHDPRHLAEIARDIGYRPKTILCVPLVHNERVIGVLELLDKTNDEPFTPDDMQLLFLFANQAAIALEQSRLQRSLPALVAEVLESIEVLPEHERRQLADEMSAFAQTVEGDERLLRAAELAKTVAEIARYGDDETEACQAILRGFREYLASRPDSLEQFAQNA